MAVIGQVANSPCDRQTTAVRVLVVCGGLGGVCRGQGLWAAFSKSLSKELGPCGVRANTVSPGPVETALWLGPGGVAETLGRAQGSDPAAVKAAAVAGTPTGRFTHPSEVAQLVLLLGSETAGNITGADVLIDGGMVSTL